jgi:hypothetical protein
MQNLGHQYLHRFFLVRTMHLRTNIFRTWYHTSGTDPHLTALHPSFDAYLKSSELSSTLPSIIKFYPQRNVFI